jgi:hypothetical protein
MFTAAQRLRALLTNQSGPDGPENLVAEARTVKGEQ